MAFLNYAYSRGRTSYRPDELQSMEDLIWVLASKSDLTYAELFINFSDAGYFKRSLPPTTALLLRPGEYEFQPEIMDFPIGFSFAIYPDLKGPATMTPLLWTRGLQNYETFNAPYSGHVAFLDGHIEYFQGEPGEHDPTLVKLFGRNSEFSKTIRILEHEPENWSTEPLTPLPVRYAKSSQPKPFQTLGVVAAFCSPAVIAAFLVALLPKPTLRQRLWSALIAFGLVLIATLILVPTVSC